MSNCRYTARFHVVIPLTLFLRPHRVVFNFMSWDITLAFRTQGKMAADMEILVVIWGMVEETSECATMRPRVGEICLI